MHNSSIEYYKIWAGVNIQLGCLYPTRLISCTDSSHPLSCMHTTSGSAPIIGLSQSVTHLPNWTLFAGCCLIAATNNYLTITLPVELLCCLLSLFELWHLKLMPCPNCVCILWCVCHDFLPIKHISIYLLQLLSTQQLVYMAIQIGRAVHFLHQHNILHRDIATRNCL